jgi:HlyD family secretion protein
MYPLERRKRRLVVSWIRNENILRWSILVKKCITLLVALSILAALLSATGTWKRAFPAETKLADDSTIAVVKRVDLVSAVASTGRVVSNLDVDIKCRASGEVIKLPFDISNRVTKGQLLLELDPVDQQRYVRKAQTAVAQSKARFAQAQRSLMLAEVNAVTTRKRAEAAVNSAEVKARIAEAKARRRKRMLEAKLGSAEDLDTAEVETAAAQADLETSKVQTEEVKEKILTIEVRRHEMELAKAQLDADQIALEDSQQQLVYTRVMAPLDGVVTTRNIQIGTIISSGITNVGGGTTVLTLSDVSRLFVLVSVDEADIGRVKLGQMAIVTADAYPGERFVGCVNRIAPKGSNTSNVVTFEVKVEVTSSNRPLLKPEMTANVKIVCQTRQNVLVVPDRAAASKGGKATVMVIRESGSPPVERPTVLGLSDGESVEIVQGLTEGERVVVPKDPASRWSNEQKQAGGPPPPPM